MLREWLGQQFATLAAKCCNVALTCYKLCRLMFDYVAIWLYHTACMAILHRVRIKADSLLNLNFERIRPVITRQSEQSLDSKHSNLYMRFY